jgi:hypothetical protein
LKKSWFKIKKKCLISNGMHLQLYYKNVTFFSNFLIKSSQFYLINGIANQFRIILVFSRCSKVVNRKIVKKISNYIFAFKCISLYNDIHDLFSLVYFKFHLDLDPVFEIFGKIFFFKQLTFYRHQLF